MFSKETKKQLNIAPMRLIKFRNTNIYGFFLVILACGISLFSLKYFFLPFFWIALTWFLVIIYGLLIVTTTTIRVILVNIGAIILTLGIFELYLSHKANELKYTYEKDYFVPHEFLGYAPQKGFKHYSARRHFKNKLIYDVTYTIDSHGLRIGPITNNSNKNAKCVLFFGCSFTFGEGLNDDETMPYLVGSMSNGKYNTYNFGFHGYGPHQMLAILEHGLEKKITDCKPKYAIYQAIMDHVKRSAGLAYWDKDGPRYILNQNGEVIFTGRFSDNSPRKNDLATKGIDQLKKSLILEKIFFKIRSINNDIDLFVAIVDKAKTIFENRYPGSKFYVLFWDKKYRSENCEKLLDGLYNKGIRVPLINNVLQDKNCEKLLDGLYNKGIRVHLISNVLQDNDKMIYRISEYDRHPNAFANKLIAEYVINNILEQ
jgi:hypothetical protein